VYLTIELAV